MQGRSSAGTRLLVTGSQGFVGKQLRAALLARGIEAVGVDVPGSGAEQMLDLSQPTLDAEALAQRTGPVHGIIYLAARITRGSSVDAQARANLVTIAETPVRLWEAYHQVHGPTHLVFCSTFKTYGPALTQPIDPACPPQRPDPHSYGSAKALAERLLQIASQRLKSEFAIVRPTCIYGAGQHLHNAIPVFLRACLDGKAPTVFGDGQSRRDDVLASDLAYCLIEASLRRKSGAFHAGGERGRSILEVAELCCRAVEQLGGAKGLVPQTDPAHPPKWWLDQSFDITATRRELDYSPTPLLEGLKQEAAWIQAGATPESSLTFAKVKS
jgi:nucleoside-diphosphate-sugar epimerase